MMSVELEELRHQLVIHLAIHILSSIASRVVPPVAVGT